MKLVSWNVNSLRSAEEKFLQFLNSEQPEVVMLQEVRAHPDQLSLFLKFVPGYEAIFNHSGRPGYGGTAIYYRRQLPFSQITTKVGNEVLDTEGRAIYGLLANWHLFNFYVPNGSGGGKRLKYKHQFLQQIGDFIQKLLSAKQSVVIGADMNVAHTELDLYSPKTNLQSSGFLLEARKIFDQLLAIGLTDTFRLFEKGGGHDTWWSLRDPKRLQDKGWRYDYFLISSNLKDKVKKSVILKNVFGSDHCPIMLEIETV
ncbi:MAG TPA: exodeoxyribonuclease III [Patescibacteria group bacterium]|nr:exodeoxyribonuclease III [Patescibacteria group bacterium]